MYRTVPCRVCIYLLMTSARASFPNSGQSLQRLVQSESLGRQKTTTLSIGKPFLLLRKSNAKKRQIECKHTQSRKKWRRCGKLFFSGYLGFEMETFCLLSRLHSFMSKEGEDYENVQSSVEKKNHLSMLGRRQLVIDLTHRVVSSVRRKRRRRRRRRSIRRRRRDGGKTDQSSRNQLKDIMLDVLCVDSVCVYTERPNLFRPLTK